MFVVQRRKLCIGKTGWIVSGTNTTEAMLRRILQMVSLWCHKVNRIAFVSLNDSFFLEDTGLSLSVFTAWTHLLQHSVLRVGGVFVFSQREFPEWKESATLSDSSEHIERSLCGVETASH